MSLDRQTLNLAAAALSLVGSLAALIDGITSGGWRSATSRASLVSGLFGTVGSAAWVVSAYQELQATGDDTVAG